MEKLIELLNEFRENQWYKWWLIYWPFWARQWDLNFIFNHTKFPFIKWLVENDKIDRDEIIINSEFMPIAFDRKWEKYEWSEEKQLLMLLSISSSPIDDLISYLK